MACPFFVPLLDLNLVFDFPFSFRPIHRVEGLLRLPCWSLGLAFGFAFSFRCPLSFEAAFTLSFGVRRRGDQGALLSFLQVTPCALGSWRGGADFALVVRFTSFALS